MGGSAGAAAMSCSASQKLPNAGNQRMSLEQGGKSRSFILHVPAKLDAMKPLALVLDFHGASGSGSQQQGLSGWDKVADREGFLTVYADGTGGYWNVDDVCCGVAGSSKVDDVGFARAIVKKLSADLCIDARRVFASGFSNGGGLAHRLGCQAADLFAAIAPVATDLRTQPCAPSRPISMIEFRGTADSLEPYAGGIVGPPGGEYNSPGAQGSLKLWAEINGCSGSAMETTRFCEGFMSCQANVETELCSIPNADHDSYHNSQNYDIATTAWQFFLRHQL